VLHVILGAAACSSTPFQATAAGPPTLVQPVDGAQIHYGDAVTLLLTGRLSDGAVFEFARDPSFTPVWLTFTYRRQWCGQVGLTCTSHGGTEQTSLQLGTDEPLTNGDYYWHANLGSTGEFSLTSQIFDLFSVKNASTSAKYPCERLHPLSEFSY
jgi:hypothetical protein